MVDEIFYQLEVQLLLIQLLGDLSNLFTMFCYPLAVNQYGIDVNHNKVVQGLTECFIHVPLIDDQWVDQPIWHHLVLIGTGEVLLKFSFVMI